MNKVRMAIIGCGGMGATHARNMANIHGAELVAVCDTDKHKADTLASDSGVKAWYSSDDLIESNMIDAVLIVTPHYSHTTIGIKALKAGLHVLVEKPISVHKNDCERLIAAHKKKSQIFAAMFNQRTDPHYQKVRELIQSGELGEFTRINWIITDWFRTQSYYDYGGWRATWEGEGGGVLLNQSPHQLDLLYWLCGMPKAVRAHCHRGKYHLIEVEDEVTAYLEYENGATGVFITSTGEAPGTNRLEITGTKGKVVIENGTIHFTRNTNAMDHFSRTSNQAFAKPDTWEIDIPANGWGGQHTEILQNFIDAILSGKELIAPAEEGINSVELANAMLYSSMTRETVPVPLDGDSFEALLKKLISESTFVKAKSDTVIVEMAHSF